MRLSLAWTVICFFLAGVRCCVDGFGRRPRMRQASYCSVDCYVHLDLKQSSLAPFHARVVAFPHGMANVLVVKSRFHGTGFVGWQTFATSSFAARFVRSMLNCDVANIVGCLLSFWHHGAGVRHLASLPIHQWSEGVGSRQHFAACVCTAICVGSSGHLCCHVFLSCYGCFVADAL